MNDLRRLLVVEGASHDYKITCDLLAEGREQSFEPIWMNSLNSGLAYLRTHAVDAVLLDLTLPDSDGLDTYLQMAARAPGTAIILLTGLQNEKTGAEAVRRGAQDCLIKGELDGNWLASTIIYGIERQKIRNGLNLQIAVSQILDEEETLEPAASRILQEMCEILGWDCASFWTVDDIDNVIRCESYWEQPMLELNDLEHTSLGLIFTNGAGLPGRVWAAGHPVWIADLQSDPMFASCSALRRAGLRAAFGFPMVSHRKVVGVIDLFSRARREPDEETMNSIAAIGSQIGQTIMRKQAEKRLLDQERVLQMVINSIPVGVAVADNSYRMVLFNAAGEKIVGKGLTDKESALWPENYGLCLSEDLTPCPHEQLPLVRAVKGEEVNGEELYINQPDRPGCWVSCSSRPLVNADGIITGGVVVFEDITEKKRTDAFRLQLLDLVTVDEGSRADRILDLVSNICRVLG